MDASGVNSSGRMAAAKRADAERRAADAERKRRSRAGMREKGVPTQGRIDGALVDAMAWCMRRTSDRELRPVDFREPVTVDGSLILSRALQILLGDPRRAEDVDRQRRKVVAEKVIERITSERWWWVGAWTVPRSRPSFTSASQDTMEAADGTSGRHPVAMTGDGEAMVDDGDPMDADGDDDWVHDAPSWSDLEDDIGPESPLDTHMQPIDGHE